MSCPNCGDHMNTYFLSTSHLDHGCLRCGCIVDWETGLIVMYDDQRTYEWEQVTGRRRKDPKEQRDARERRLKLTVPCMRCGARILPTTSGRTGGLCMPCFTAYKKKEEEERRARVRAARLSAGQCVMCGKALGFFQRVLGNDRHSQCTEFKE